MAEKFLMPKLSPTMEEGQISRWVKNEGDSYEANETLAEVDTDKATMEMTALTAGTLLKILKGAGESALLGEAIAIIGNKDDDISALVTEVSASGPANKDEEKRSGGEEEAKVPSPKSQARWLWHPLVHRPQPQLRNPQSAIPNRTVVLSCRP